MWRALCNLQLIILLGLYTYLGLTPHPETKIPMFADWIMHSTGYVIAGFSLSFAKPWWPYWQRALFLIGYSFAIEVGQHFSPPRTFSLPDMLANTLGTLLGLALVCVLHRYCHHFRAVLRFGVKRNS